VRVPITEISGRSVYHCHILDHEDLGMMGVINVS
jgi:FtsP/CotA-like multicopper oxidase with cupredoxin domain